MSHPQLRAAIALHQSGQLVQAEALYRQVLRESPEEADAHHLLGLVLETNGRKAEAIALVERALALRPCADYLNSLGLIREGAADLAAALDCFRRAIALDPRHAKAWNNLGGLLQAQGRLGEAETAYRRAIALAPQMFSSLNNLGTVLQAQAKIEEAIRVYRGALALRPNYPEALANLASACVASGQFPEAIAAAEGALRLKPTYGRALLQLGLALLAMGKAAESLEPLARAADALPGQPEAPFERGRALSLVGRHAEAKASLEESLRRNPAFVPAIDAMASLLLEMVDPAAADLRYRQALALSPTAALRIKHALMMPAVCQSAEEIAARRAAMEAALDELLASPLEVGQPLAAASSGGFFLAYHGQDDRRLQEKIAAVYTRACPALAFEAGHCHRAAWRDRLRVGLISRFMFRHSIGRTTQGLVAGLDRRVCEIEVLFVPPLVDDDISGFIRNSADHWQVLSADLERARQEIASRELDVLFYQDIGMDPFTYFLAFSRLAPVQCVSFGHPNTTGIPAMDYFVSSSLYEPPGAAAHYSETLFALHDLGTLAYYYRPSLQRPAKSRAQFGLPEDQHVYLCPQSLFKVHPDIDALFAGILRQDAWAGIYLVEGRVPQRAAKLRERFSRTIPDVADRVFFLPGTSDVDFLNLVAVCDVMLDTLHFNGMNTSLEAFAMGIPVVTCPGSFQRGRHTAAMYRRMGLGDYVAGDTEEYLRMALRLGQDSDFRAAASASILERNGVLFEDHQVLREFERFFQSARSAPASSG